MLVGFLTQACVFSKRGEQASPTAGFRATPLPPEQCFDTILGWPPGKINESGRGWRSGIQRASRQRKARRT